MPNFMIRHDAQYRGFLITGKPRVLLDTTKAPTTKGFPGFLASTRTLTTSPFPAPYPPWAWNNGEKIQRKILW